MNNLRLTFSGVELSRLRALVTAVGKEIGLVPGAVSSGGGQAPKTALDMTWSRLVEMLDLGAEPEMHTCPECHQPCAPGATRCGHCWKSLPPATAKAEKAA
jgi:hypothetical protein